MVAHQPSDMPASNFINKWLEQNDGDETIYDGTSGNLN